MKSYMRLFLCVVLAGASLALEREPTKMTFQSAPDTESLHFMEVPKHTYKQHVAECKKQFNCLSTDESCRKNFHLCLWEAGRRYSEWKKWNLAAIRYHKEQMSHLHDKCHRQCSMATRKWFCKKTCVQNGVRDLKKRAAEHNAKLAQRQVQEKKVKSDAVSSCKTKCSKEMAGHARRRCESGCVRESLVKADLAKAKQDKAHAIAVESKHFAQLAVNECTRRFAAAHVTNRLARVQQCVLEAGKRHHRKHKHFSSILRSMRENAAKSTCTKKCKASSGSCFHRCVRDIKRSASSSQRTLARLNHAARKYAGYSQRMARLRLLQNRIRAKYLARAVAHNKLYIKRRASRYCRRLCHYKHKTKLTRTVCQSKCIPKRMAKYIKARDAKKQRWAVRESKAYTACVLGKQCANTRGEKRFFCLYKCKRRKIYHALRKAQRAIWRARVHKLRKKRRAARIKVKAVTVCDKKCVSAASSAKASCIKNCVKAEQVRIATRRAAAARRRAARRAARKAARAARVAARKAKRAAELAAARKKAEALAKAECIGKCSSAAGGIAKAKCQSICKSHAYHKALNAAITAHHKKLQLARAQRKKAADAKRLEDLRARRERIKKHLAGVRKAAKAKAAAAKAAAAKAAAAKAKAAAIAKAKAAKALAAEKAAKDKAAFNALLAKEKGKKSAAQAADIVKQRRKIADAAAAKKAALAKRKERNAKDKQKNRAIERKLRVKRNCQALCKLSKNGKACTTRCIASVNAHYVSNLAASKARWAAEKARQAALCNTKCASSKTKTTCISKCTKHGKALYEKAEHIRRRYEWSGVRNKRKRIIHHIKYCNRRCQSAACVAKCPAEAMTEYKAWSASYKKLKAAAQAACANQCKAKFDPRCTPRCVLKKLRVIHRSEAAKHHRTMLRSIRRSHEVNYAKRKCAPITDAAAKKKCISEHVANWESRYQQRVALWKARKTAAVAYCKAKFYNKPKSRPRCVRAILRKDAKQDRSARARKRLRAARRNKWAHKRCAAKCFYNEKRAACLKDCVPKEVKAIKAEQAARLKKLTAECNAQLATAKFASAAHREVAVHKCLITKLAASIAVQKKVRAQQAAKDHAAHQAKVAALKASALKVRQAAIAKAKAAKDAVAAAALKAKSDAHKTATDLKRQREHSQYSGQCEDSLRHHKFNTAQEHELAYSKCMVKKLEHHIKKYHKPAPKKAASVKTPVKPKAPEKKKVPSVDDPKKEAKKEKIVAKQMKQVKVTPKKKKVESKKAPVVTKKEVKKVIAKPVSNKALVKTLADKTAVKNAPSIKKQEAVLSKHAAAKVAVKLHMRSPRIRKRCSKLCFNNVGCTKHCVSKRLASLKIHLHAEEIKWNKALMKKVPACNKKCANEVFCSRKCITSAISALRAEQRKVRKARVAATQKARMSYNKCRFAKMSKKHLLGRCKQESATTAATQSCQVAVLAHIKSLCDTHRSHAQAAKNAAFTQCQKDKNCRQWNQLLRRDKCNAQRHAMIATKKKVLKAAHAHCVKIEATFIRKCAHKYAKTKLTAAFAKYYTDVVKFCT